MQENENADFISLSENIMMQENRKSKLCMTSVGQNHARNNKNQKMHDTPRKITKPTNQQNTKSPNHITLNSAFTNVILIISKKHLKTSIGILFRGEKQWKKVMFL